MAVYSYQGQPKVQGYTSEHSDSSRFCTLDSVFPGQVQQAHMALNCDSSRAAFGEGLREGDHSR